MTEVFYYDYVTIEPWTYFLTASEFGLTYVGLKGDETVSPIFSFYPHRMLVRNPKRLAPYVQQLKEYFAGTRKELDVPIDISEFGTEFQRRVLQTSFRNLQKTAAILNPGFHSGSRPELHSLGKIAVLKQIRRGRGHSTQRPDKTEQNNDQSKLHG